MTLTPKVFSPNNDGNDDFLIIQLQFPTSGYSGRITIFDSKVREVKSLLNNTLLGTINTYYWDGINENGNKAAIGRYIIYVKATHSNKLAVQEKQTTVIGR